MRSYTKTSLAMFLTVLMISHVASAATSFWNGPSGLSGTSQTVSDAFEVPGNATVIDAWLHVDESGYLEDGYGVTWTGEDVPGNFTSGQFSNTMIGKFEGAMSLMPDSAVSNVESFSSASLQLPSAWSHTGSIWEAVNPSSMNGTVSGTTRTMTHGSAPATAADGGVVAATLPGQGLPTSSSGALIAPQFAIPSPINNFNLSFAHSQHLDSNDGAWVEYKLDNGPWTYIAPSGGYTSTISANASVPNGANGSGFAVFGDGNFSGWNTVVFNLDNLSGISNATLMQFRFQVWTDSNSTPRPGWFLDSFSVTNQGNSVGYWHHGCYSQTGGTCLYSNNAHAALESAIDLSNTSTGSKVQTRLEFDLEGSSYDNFCIELSTDNGTTWTDISSGTSSTTTDCRSRTGSIPGSGYTLPNGTTVFDDSGGFVTLDFSIPQTMLGSNNSSKIRYVVQTDGSVQYGTSNDEREGLTVDWFKVINSNGTTADVNQLSNTSSASNYAINNAANDWAFIQIGAGGLSITDSLEDAPALPPGGWSISNQAGQTGWQFGAVCSNYTDGPTSFPSANLGFGTNLCGDYDSSSDNSLYSPSYYVPLGASARFVWQHWMCAEDGWDGGLLYVSTNGGAWNQAFVNYTNSTNWYDGTITSTSGFIGTNVWDGRQYVAASGQFSCTSSANIPWLSMEYDVSNLSGNNVSFRFRQISDTAVQEPGWYVDDIGLEVDWFETEGSWRSPLISTNDLGYGFVDADVILPANTWYGVDVLDASGQLIPGHENMSLPLSLASIDRDNHSGIYIEVNMGTDDQYYTPLVRELTVGATRYFGDSNGWNIPSSLTRLSNGTWVNNGGGTIAVTGDSGLSSRPISSATLTGNFTGVTASLTTSGTQSVTTTSVNSVLDLGDMRTSIAPRVTFAPGASVSELVFRGAFAQPASGATIDLADDGVIDWEFSSMPGYGSYGWQTQINSNQIEHSLDIQDTGTLSVMIPDGANVHTMLIGLNPNGSTSPLAVSSGSNQFYQITYTNWSTSVVAISNPQFATSGTYTDSSGRDWSMIDIEFASNGSNFNIGSFAIGYNLLENVSGLGQTVKDYHDQNSNNGQIDIVNVPITWTASTGGVAIDGGVYHENMITNHPFNVPITWYPTGELQGFITQHHHLLGNENIDEIHLIGMDSSGDSVTITVTDIHTSPVFTQSSGFGMLKLHNNSSVTEIGGRLVVDWQFEVDWDWNDSQSVIWTAQAYEIIAGNLEGLSPATAQSGDIGIQASENDLQVDTWKVVDFYGHELSDMFSPDYPFWAKSGSQVSVSGTVRFENTLDLRPQTEDFEVAVSVGGSDVILNSTSNGQWTGLVTLPVNNTQVNLTPYVIRAGPATGASGAEDTTFTSPVTVLLDSESPYASNLQVNSGQRLLAADGYTWDPSTPLSLQVTITDNQALGNEVVMHYWRQELDDTNLDGVADESEYRTMSKPLPEGVAGERTVSFGGIDVSGMQMNAKLSVYFTSIDYAGHELLFGGSPGLDNDMATMIIAVNEPTTIPLSSLELDSVSDQLLAGQMHNLTMEISDANGVDSIDIVTVKLLGADVDEVGVMNWEPRNGAIYTNNDSQLTLHDVITTQGDGDSWYVSWHFSLDWDFDESLVPEYALPAIVVFDDDDLNPVALLTNLGDIRWQLDNDLKVTLDEKSDNTPPISQPSSGHIFVQPGDDLTFTGKVVYSKSGIPVENLPSQGLEVTVSTSYGSEPLQVYAEVVVGGSWETGLILPSRSLSTPELVVDYSITGVPLPGYDLSSLNTMITVDETSPVVQFSTAPLSLNDEELETLQYSVLIIEEGGMPAGDIEVNWAFLRNGLIMDNGQSSSIIPYIANNSGTWTYSGSVDFTEGVNVTLVEGDELIWWVDVVDLAGNAARGTGLSEIDPMNTIFTVLSFDLTVTNIEITLADGSIPRGNEVVEGTEIGVVVQVRNLGTKAGTVKISLVEDLGATRNWLSHGEVDLTIAPGQTMETIPLLFETYGAGNQNLYVNVSGMDLWIENSMLPHCSSINGNATCDLDVESDMPRVISQDDAESGLDGTALTIGILALLLIGAAFAIIVLMRREKSDDSIFYDDDEWEEDDIEDFQEQKVTPILPPMTSDRPALDSASEILNSNDGNGEDETVETQNSDEEKDSYAQETTADEVEEPVVEPVEESDPWADVEHSE